MKTNSRAGFTLIEMMISLALLAVVLGAVGLVSGSSRSAYEEASLRSTAERKCRQALERVATELGSLGRTTMNPNPAVANGTSTLTFRQPSGVAAAAIVWGDPIQLLQEYAPGEVDNGVDDTGDGLVDEGQLVLVRDAGGLAEQRVVLCSNVPEFAFGETLDGVDQNGNGIADERGFNVRQVGDLLNVRLEVVEIGRRGRNVSRAFETSLRMRN